MMSFLDLIRLSGCNLRLQRAVSLITTIQYFNTVHFKQKQKMTCVDILELLYLRKLQNFTQFVHSINISTTLIISTNPGIEIRHSHFAQQEIVWLIGVGLPNEFPPTGKMSFKTSTSRHYIPIAKPTSNSLCTVWTDLVDGSGFLVSWFLKTFETGFDNLRVSKGNGMDCTTQLWSLIPYIKNHKFENCEITEPFRPFLDSNLKHIIDNVSVKNELKIIGFRELPFHNFRAYETRSLVIDRAKWFSIENLRLATNCVFIELLDSCLNEMDLNRFLKEWKSDAFPNLKCLKIRKPYLDLFGATFGINTVKERLHGFYKLPGTDSINIQNGTTIANDSESTFATFMLTAETGQLSRDKIFQMVVWPDFHRNDWSSLIHARQRLRRNNRRFI
ncbi:hypothetical protein CAEBREN_17724 [Caenorhabditis brenneri]|uniref:Sdz-33 F-box domain-containing protein n=1 Tax=Caenorhabditis brenneri TaxID=135651 RepID=G0NKU9_CAEBE|nr:hypothetical protein CAEBREN_17724 [Caenorhabditis brenneri]